MSADPAFSRRIVRLSATSVLALGLIWYLWRASLHTPEIVGAGLAGGWVLMPSVLILSLRWPRLRVALIIPSVLESLALISICVIYLPVQLVARLGWELITGGILLGDILGGWLWFHWAQVPPRLANPFSAARWTLITIHIALIVGGVGLVGLSALQGGSLVP